VSHAEDHRFVCRANPGSGQEAATIVHVGVIHPIVWEDGSELLEDRIENLPDAHAGVYAGRDSIKTIRLLST
jgi:hypothetical protein